MNNWWPYPIEFLPVVRSAGRKLRLVAHAGNACALKYVPPLTLKEQQLPLPKECIFILGRVLDQGVKHFEIPKNMREPLDQIAINLKVREYTQPFPAVVVKCGDEYHFVVVERNRLFISTHAARNGITTLDYMSCCDPEAVLEDRLNAPNVMDHVQGKVIATDEFYRQHRFRATLNFLLVCSMEGVLGQRTKIPKHFKSNTVRRKLAGNTYKPQNIGLLRERYGTPQNPAPHLQGIGKRPHWRRAHWRRVAVGKGRIDRELRFFPAMFIHRELIGGLDSTDTNYKV